MNLYRVFPWDAGAADDQPGGALFAVDSNANRISNLELYHTLYLAAQPEAAIAEALGHLLTWRRQTFVHPVGPLALATYTLADHAAVFDLDDIASLTSIGVQHPSRIITRDRSMTRAWARTIFERSLYAGARWWSYYNPDWTAYGLWNIGRLQIAAVPEALTIDSPAVVAAARAIAKQRISGR